MPKLSRRTKAKSILFSVDPAENIKLNIVKLEITENRLFDMTLDAALLIAQTLHIALLAENGKLILWCPGVVVPRDVTRVLRANTSEVLRLIGLAHVSVCPSPELHAHSWQYTVKRDCCTLCARLDYWMDKCA